MAATTGSLADGREHFRISNYSGFWQKDLQKEAAIDTENRIDHYTEVVNGTQQFTVSPQTIHILLMGTR